jgi:hypothetical protein
MTRQTLPQSEGSRQSAVHYPAAAPRSVRGAPFASKTSPPPTSAVVFQRVVQLRPTAMPAVTDSPRVVAQRQQRTSLLGGAVQRKKKEEFRGKARTAQRVTKIKEKKPLQRRAANGSATVQSHAQSNRTGLPDHLKSGIESLSGISLDNVQVHYNSAKPAQLNALAYTQGTDIHVAPGQQKHLPHEAWHVVQQAQGRVRPTMQMKGAVPVNDDQALEHEADVMGARASAYGGSRGKKQPGLTSGQSAFSRNQTRQLSNRQAPVQRLIGFEVEYMVPTFHTPSVAVEFTDPQPPEGKDELKRFLFGGLKYGKDLGGSAKKGDNSFRVTSDHDGEVSRDSIRAKLARMGKLNPADAEDEDASSNLEYVTSPVDELARGSDKALATMIDALATHAKSTFRKARRDKTTALGAPATNVETGTPVSALKAWLSDEEFASLKPKIKKFQKNIADECYLQATVGVLPSAVGALFARAQGAESLQDTTEGDIWTAIQTAYTAVETAVLGHAYLTGLGVDAAGVQQRDAVLGLIRLLVMYLVGEALSKTEAFPGGSIKNAVPFLLKVDPSTISKAAPHGMRDHAVTAEFIAAVATSIKAQPQIKSKYWRKTIGEARRDRGEKWVTEGRVKNLVRMFLQGKKPDDTDVQTGAQLKKLDRVKPIRAAADKQKGIPLEYRYIKAHPSAENLKPELLKLVAEARAVNLSRVPADKKLEIEGQVRE